MGKYDSLVAEAPPKKGKYDDLVAETPPVAAPLEPPIATPSRAQLAAATGKLDARTQPVDTGSTGPESQVNIRGRRREQAVRDYAGSAMDMPAPMENPLGAYLPSIARGAAGAELAADPEQTRRVRAAGVVAAGEEAMSQVLPYMGVGIAKGAAAAPSAARYLGTVGAEIAGGLAAEQGVSRGLQAAGVSPEVSKAAGFYGTLPLSVAAVAKTTNKALRGVPENYRVTPDAPPPPRVDPRPQPPMLPEPARDRLARIMRENPPPPSQAGQAAPVEVPTGTPRPYQQTSGVVPLEPARSVPAGSPDMPSPLMAEHDALKNHRARQPNPPQAAVDNYLSRLRALAQRTQTGEAPTYEASILADVDRAEAQALLGDPEHSIVADDALSKIHALLNRQTRPEPPRIDRPGDPDYERVRIPPSRRLAAPEWHDENAIPLPGAQATGTQTAPLVDTPTRVVDIEPSRAREYAAEIRAGLDSEPNEGSRAIAEELATALEKYAGEVGDQLGLYFGDVTENLPTGTMPKVGMAERARITEMFSLWKSLRQKGASGLSDIGRAQVEAMLQRGQDLVEPPLQDVRQMSIPGAGVDEINIKPQERETLQHFGLPDQDVPTAYPEVPDVPYPETPRARLEEMGFRPTTVSDIGDPITTHQGQWRVDRPDTTLGVLQREGGNPLDDAVRSAMEQVIGRDRLSRIDALANAAFNAPDAKTKRAAWAEMKKLQTDPAYKAAVEAAGKIREQLTRHEAITSQWKQADVSSTASDDAAASRMLAEMADEIEAKAAASQDPREALIAAEQARQLRMRADRHAERALAEFERVNAEFLGAGRKAEADRAAQARQSGGGGSGDGRPLPPRPPGAAPEPTPQSTAQGPSPWGALKSIEASVRDFGETGEKLGGMLREKSTLAKGRAGQWSAPLLEHGLQSMNESELANLTDVLSGDAAPISKRVEEVAATARDILNQIGQFAEGLDVDVKPGSRDAEIRSKFGDDTADSFQMLENYIPRVVYGHRTYLTGTDLSPSGGFGVLYKSGKGRWTQVAKDVMANMVRKGYVTGEEGGRSAEEVAEAVMRQFVKFQTEQISSPGQIPDLMRVLRSFNPRKSAPEILQSLRRRTDVSQPMFGSLERHRELDISPLADPNMRRVLPRYIERASERLSEIEIFGQRMEKVQEVLDKAAEGGASRESLERIKEFVSTSLGGQEGMQTDLAATFKRLTKAQLVKLGLAWLPNVFQPVNNLYYTRDFGSFVKAFAQVTAEMSAELATKPLPESMRYKSRAHEVARVSGATLESSVRKMTAGDVETGKALEWTLKAFSGSEEYVRAVSAMTGFRWAGKLRQALKAGGAAAERAAIELQGMGLDPKMLASDNPSIVEQAKLDVAQRLNDITNFSSNALDTPAFLHGKHSAFFRTIWQYKTYPYGMGRMVARRMRVDAQKLSRMDEPSKKAWATSVAGNLALIAAAYPPVGMTVSYLRAQLYDLISGNEEATDRWAEDYNSGVNYILNGLGSTAALGLFTAGIDAAEYPGGVSSFLAGPTAADFAEGFTESVKLGRSLADEASAETAEDAEKADAAADNALYSLLRLAIRSYTPFGAGWWRLLQDPLKDAIKDE